MIMVSYGGENLPVNYSPDCAIKDILTNVRSLFGTKTPGLGLFTENGIQLDIIRKAGDFITPGELIILRPAVVH